MRKFRIAVAALIAVLFAVPCFYFGGLISSYLADSESCNQNVDLGRILVAVAAMVAMVWAGTWDVVSQRDVRRFAVVFSLTNMLPGIVAFVVGFIVL